MVHPQVEGGAGRTMEGSCECIKVVMMYLKKLLYDLT